MITDNEKASDAMLRDKKADRQSEINENSPAPDASYDLPEKIRLEAKRLIEKLDTLTALLEKERELKIPGAVIANLTEQGDELRTLALQKRYEAGIREMSAECDRVLKGIKAENRSRGPLSAYDEEYYNKLIRETALYEKGLDGNTVQRPGSLYGRKFRKHKKDDTAYILTRRGKIEKVIFAIVFTVFTLHSISLVIPVLWMVISSFKDSVEYVQSDAFALPEKWLFENYATSFKMLNTATTSFFGMIFNSIWWTLITSSLDAFIPTITGYVMSKYKFAGRNLIFTLAIGTMIIPIVGALAAGMKMVSFLGLYDNPLYAVIAHLGGFSGAFLIYYGFFNSVSNAYGEAAKIDGAGPFSIFFKIILPQAIPIMMTFLITNSIGQWNEYMTMVLYLPSYPTLASGLFEYQSNAVRAINYPVYYAGLILSMIPTLILFASFSNKIMTTLSIGGLKG